MYYLHTRTVTLVYPYCKKFDHFLFAELITSEDLQWTFTGDDRYDPIPFEKLVSFLRAV